MNNPKRGRFANATLIENNNGYVGKIYVDNTYKIITNNKKEKEIILTK